VRIRLIATSVNIALPVPATACPGWPQRTGGGPGRRDGAYPAAGPRSRCILV